MALRLLWATMAMWTGVAVAQSDPLAPLPVQRSTLQYPPLSPAPVSALTGFASYKQTLSARARAAGVREATIQATVPWLTLNNRVIQLDRGQPGASMFRHC